MDVLFVTHHYLHGNGGGVFASRAYINAFEEISRKFTLLYPAKRGYDVEEISSNDKVPVYYEKSKRLKFIDALCGRTHRYFDVFEKQLKNNDYKVVVFDSSRVSFRLIDIAHKYGLKVITIHHNFEAEYIKDNENLIMKPVLLYWVKKYEKESVQKSNLNLTLTGKDRDLLLQNYTTKKPIAVLGCFEYKRKERDFGRNIQQVNKKTNFVITGSLNTKQTQESLIYWLNEYYPLLKKNIPETTLTIAGNNPSQILIQKCEKWGITLISSPKSMDEILENADIYICPVSLGGGLKLRIMDGLKRGLPVISHKVSARGYEDFSNAGHLFEYDDKNSFDKALDKIKTNDFNKNDMIEKYNFIFSFDAGKQRLAKFLKEYKII